MAGAVQRTAIGCAAFVFSLGAGADAGERAWYVGIEGGKEFAGTLNDSYSDTGYAVIATVGRALGSHFSVEGELGYRSTSEFYFGPTDTTQTSVMVNAVYEAAILESVSVSIGAGVGLDRISIESPGGLYIFALDIEDTQTAVQLKLGLSLALTENLDLTANYRAMSTFENEIVDYDNSTLTVGLRFAL